MCMNLEVHVVDVLEDERRSLRRGIANHVEQLNDVRSASQILKNLDLALDLFLLHGLEDLKEKGSGSASGSSSQRRGGERSQVR